MTSEAIPAFTVGIFVSIYWLSVLAMAARNWFFPARARPVKPPTVMDRVLRWLWFPVIVSWVMVPYIVALGHSRVSAVIPWAVLARSPLPWVGVGIAGLALIFTIVCWKEMGVSWQMGIETGDKPPLVTTGLYTHIRHPI